MKLILFKTLSNFLYIISLILFGIYIIYEFKTNVFISPFTRVFLLLATCFFLYFGSFFKCLILNKQDKNKIMIITNWIFFILYIILLVTLVLFDTMFGRNIDNIFITKISFNIIPFKSILEYIFSFVNHTKNSNIIITNLLGNLIAFTPFAFFLPLLINKFDNFKKLFVIILMIVISVETLQLITARGIFDIDDVILNVTGALVMYQILNIYVIKQFIIKIFLLNNLRWK